LNYHFKWAPITLTPRRATSQAQNTNSKYPQLWSSITKHLPPFSMLHDFSTVLCLFNREKPSSRMKLNKLQINFFPFCNILDQSSHTHVQPFFHLRVIMSESRFIMQIRIKIICSCMQRPVKLMIPPLINNFPNRLIAT